MIKSIPLSVPYLSGREWTYVKDCLDEAWLSSLGKYVNDFEDAVAKQIGRPAVACVNGTGALHMAYLLLGVKPGDEVIMPALSFISPANALRYVGAYPVFMDVDPVHWQMDPSKMEDFLLKGCRYKNGVLINKVTRRQVKAIAVVHLLGQSANMLAITRLAKKFRLKIVEDVAEGIGASCVGKPLGSWGDIGCFSFNGNKIITCGGGGMIVTKTKTLAKRAKYLTTQAKNDEVEYIHHEVGYNYRLTNVQAAIGLAQLENLKEYIRIKHQIAERYTNALKGVPGITVPTAGFWSSGYWWLYTILIDERKFKESSRQLLARLQRQGIQSRPLWHPLHSLRPFKGSYAHKVDVAMKLYRQALSLPSSVGLSLEDQMTTIAHIVKSV